MIDLASGVKAFRPLYAKNLKLEATELEIGGRDSLKMRFWAKYPLAGRCSAGLDAVAFDWFSTGYFQDSRVLWPLVEGCNA